MLLGLPAASPEPEEKPVAGSWCSLRAGSGHIPNNNIVFTVGHISPKLKVERVLPIKPLRASPERITMLLSNLVVSQKNVKYTKRGGSADMFHS